MYIHTYIHKYIYIYIIYILYIYICTYIHIYINMKKDDENQRQSTKVYTQPVSLLLFFKCLQSLRFCFTCLTLSRYQVGNYIYYMTLY